MDQWLAVVKAAINFGGQRMLGISYYINRMAGYGLRSFGLENGPMVGCCEGGN
jgi:hypothetical protein